MPYGEYLCNYDCNGFFIPSMLSTLSTPITLGNGGNGIGYDENFVTLKITSVSFADEIEKVIFNPPATIIFWKDGSKTIVKAQPGEEFDPEKGFAIAVVKKAFGNKGKYYNTIRKWVSTYSPKEEDTLETMDQGIMKFINNMSANLDLAVKNEYKK